MTFLVLRSSERIAVADVQKTVDFDTIEDLADFARSFSKVTLGYYKPRHSFYIEIKDKGAE